MINDPQFVSEGLKIFLSGNEVKMQMLATVDSK